MRAVRFEPRDLAVDFALLALGVADGGIGAGDFLGDRGKGGAPFGDRPRLALFADARPATPRQSARRICGARVAALIAPCRLARSSFSASMRLSSSGRLTGGAGRGGLVSIAPIVSFAPRLALDPQRGRIQRQRKILATSVLSPAGRSSVMTRVTLAPSG